MQMGAFSNKQRRHVDSLNLLIYPVLALERLPAESPGLHAGCCSHLLDD